MLHDETSLVQVLVFRVGLGVPEQVEEGLRGLLWPAALVTRSFLLLTLGMATAASCKDTDGDRLFFLEHIFEVFHRGIQSQALDGSADLAAVLEMHPLVRHAGLAGLSG